MLPERGEHLVFCGHGFFVSFGEGAFPQDEEVVLMSSGRGALGGIVFFSSEISLSLLFSLVSCDHDRAFPLRFEGAFVRS